MGYNINSFFDIFVDLPKFPSGSSGKDVFSYYLDKEKARFSVEAFISVKVESILTNICSRQKEYITIYNQYKDLTPIIQNLYNSLNKES